MNNGLERGFGRLAGPAAIDIPDEKSSGFHVALDGTTTWGVLGTGGTISRPASILTVADLVRLALTAPIIDITATTTGDVTISTTSGTVFITAQGGTSDVDISAPDDVNIHPTDDILLNPGDDITATMDVLSVQPRTGGKFSVQEPNSANESIVVDGTSTRLRRGGTTLATLSSTTQINVDVSLVRSSGGGYIYEKDGGGGGVDVSALHNSGTSGTIAVANPATIAVSTGLTHSTWSRGYGMVFPGTSWTNVFVKAEWRRINSTTIEVTIQNGTSQTFSYEIETIGA